MKLKRPIKTLLLRALVLVVLALIFSAYLAPSFVIDLANRIYLCF